jgi:hypothetical protein
LSAFAEASARHFSSFAKKNGRGGEIRTHDLYVPNVALYQAKLRPDKNDSPLAERRIKKTLFWLGTERKCRQASGSPARRKPNF